MLSNFQDVNNYIPEYQYLLRPADRFAEICRSVGYDIIDCIAPERSFGFQNINVVKSITSFFFLLSKTSCR